MEAKASRMSQRSNRSQTAAGTMSKNASKASLTPSQAAERTLMANKDPLDALSRSGARGPMAERRSGLQDVDDDYLKTVVYAFARQTGQTAADRAKVTADMIPAGVPTLRSQQYRQNDKSAAQQQRIPAGGDTVSIAGSVAPSEKSQSQLQSQIPAQKQSKIQQGQVVPASVPVPVQKQPAPVSPPAQQPVQQESNSVEKQESMSQQGGTPRQGGGGDHPELYTTCPNCRATLYLVRNAGESSPYDNQQGDAAAPQQSQQAQPQQ